MKNKLLILTLLLSFSLPSTAWTTYPTVSNGFRGNNYRFSNPFGNFYNPYRSFWSNPYSRPSSSQFKRMQKLRQRNRLKNNLFSWFNRNNAVGQQHIYHGSYNPNSAGSLTGFSTPINSSALNLIPQNKQYNINSKDAYYSPTSQMKLFSSPQNGQEIYSYDGQYYKDLHDLDGSTGVKIIYD